MAEKTLNEVQDPLQQAIARGHRALLVVGNVDDYVLQGSEVVYRRQILANNLHEKRFAVIRYSKSQGAHVHARARMTSGEQKAIDGRLNALGLLAFINQNEQNGAEEIRGFFRGLARLLQTPVIDSRPFAAVIDYTEHLAPAVHTSAAASDEQTFVAESLTLLANSPAFLKSNNLLICLTRDGLYNCLLNALHRVEFPYLCQSDAEAFAGWAVNRAEGVQPPYAHLEEGFGETELARLTRGLRLRDLDAMLREAKAENTLLSRKRVLDAKADAILRVSEETLSVIATELSLDDIIGLDVLKRFFLLIADKLKSGDNTSPRAILMVGPPGTAKSTFAPILAALSGFNPLEFVNVKNMFVGESERRLRLALSLVEQLSPAILFIDEITETTPSRAAGANDGGVSLDLLAQLFKFSARDDLRGKVLLLAASNVPERLDPAWLDRFLIVPFLELHPNETCHLLPVFERRTTGNSVLDASDPTLIEAAQLLHKKGASPRRVMDVVAHALLNTSGNLKSEDVLQAAQDYVGAANPFAVAYTSLVAILLTSFQSLLPWSQDPEAYVYPWYLKGIVNPKDGSLDREKLQMRIAEYRKRTNL